MNDKVQLHTVKSHVKLVKDIDDPTGDNPNLYAPQGTVCKVDEDQSSEGWAIVTAERYKFTFAVSIPQEAVFVEEMGVGRTGYCDKGVGEQVYASAAAPGTGYVVYEVTRIVPDHHIDGDLVVGIEIENTMRVPGDEEVGYGDYPPEYDEEDYDNGQYDDDDNEWPFEDYYC